MMEHTVKAFDEELGRLSALVARLGDLAREEVAGALQALSKRDIALAQAVVETDRKLDELEGQIENGAILLMAIRQPVAIDLRRAVAAMKMAGITHGDVDHLMIYDAFAHLPLYGLEDLGFCKIGDGGRFVADGNLISGVG